VRVSSVFISSRTVEYEAFKTFRKKKARAPPTMIEEYFTSAFSPSFTGILHPPHLEASDLA
jgi:hypothetical protein